MKMPEHFIITACGGRRNRHVTFRISKPVTGLPDFLGKRKSASFFHFAKGDIEGALGRASAQYADLLTNMLSKGRKKDTLLVTHVRLEEPECVVTIGTYPIVRGFSRVSGKHIATDIKLVFGKKAKIRDVVRSAVNRHASVVKGMHNL